jgi:hypothetical protein
VREVDLPEQLPGSWPRSALARAGRGVHAAGAEAYATIDAARDLRGVRAR